ncbi:MAG: class I SAM-dependent methyltransferase, partial [Thermoanaerobaculia bacterium]|nr:class I SAM-dependent methyltransferase [Thermoanaerobaculia bacterium]
QIAERGPRVFAIEPNEAMRNAGVRHPRIEWIAGNAESTTLPDESVDLVSCFQSFHWFDPSPAIDEFLRILRSPHGRVAAIWNERDPSDPFTREYGELVREISDNHPAESRETSADALYESARLGEIRRLTFPHEQVLDLEGLVGRAESTSYLPSEGPRHSELIRRLRQLFDRRSSEGRVRLRYVTSLYLGNIRGA